VLKIFVNKTQLYVFLTKPYKIIPLSKWKI